MKIQNRDFIKVLHNTPVCISNIYYDLIAQGKYKVPRKSSVLKVFKDNFRYFSGFDFKDLTVEQQQELLVMAEDSYDGIREGE